MQRELTFEWLNARRKKLKDEGKFGKFPSVIGLRARRCTSWLEPAEKAMASRDYDAAFIFYWIAFNAAYADGRVTRDEWKDERSEEQRGEREARSEYLEKVIGLDVGEEIHKVIRMRFWGPVERFVKNKYVYQPFWNYHNGLSRYKNWKSWFDEEMDIVREALTQWDAGDILIILFDRLYVLRNQLIHGGATWRGSVNRVQVKEGARIMAFLVPLFIELMMDNPDADWGAAYYPLVEDTHEH